MGGLAFMISFVTRRETMYSIRFGLTDHNGYIYVNVTATQIGYQET